MVVHIVGIITNMGFDHSIEVERIEVVGVEAVLMVEIGTADMMTINLPIGESRDMVRQEIVLGHSIVMKEIEVGKGVVDMNHIVIVDRVRVA